MATQHLRGGAAAAAQPLTGRIEVPEAEKPRLRSEDLEALHALAVELLQLEDYDEMLDASCAVRWRCWGRSRVAGPASRGERAGVRGRAQLEARASWKRRTSRSAAPSCWRSCARASPMLMQATRWRTCASPTATACALCRSVRSWPRLWRSRARSPERCTWRRAAVERLFGPQQLELFSQVLRLSSRALQACTRRIVLEQRNSLLERDILARHHFPGIVTARPGLPQAARDRRPGGAVKPAGAGARPLGQRQGADRPRPPSQQPARQEAILGDQLWCDLRVAAGERAVRPCPRRFHRGGRRQAGADPRGTRGHALSGRSRRAAEGAAGKALARPAVRRGAARGLGAARTSSTCASWPPRTAELEHEVREGRFREDLLLPAQRHHAPSSGAEGAGRTTSCRSFTIFSAQAAGAGRPVPPGLTPRLERVLRQYDWPGNVRELENEAHRLLMLTPPGAALTSSGCRAASPRRYLRRRPTRQVRPVVKRSASSCSCVWPGATERTLLGPSASAARRCANG